MRVMNHGAGPWPQPTMNSSAFGSRSPITKRRGINGIKQLLQFADMYLNDSTLRRSRIAG